MLLSINFHFTFESSISTLISAIALIVSICTFILGIVAYKRFLQNKLRDKQLETVYELIQQIQQHDWHYIQYNNFYNNNLPVYGQTLATLFDIADMEEFDDCDNLYFWAGETDDNEPSDKDKLHSWDFFYTFNSHPLLPISIAEPLKKFNLHSRQQHIVKFIDAKDKKYISLGRKKGYSPDVAYFLSYSEGEMATCKGFKKAATELRDAINKWAEKYGLNDLNITSSHIKLGKQK